MSTDFSAAEPARAPAPLAWTIAFFEGVSTLAVEVIAIRLAVPVVGSSATLNGILLGVVLFALSAGYWRGGAKSARMDASAMETTLARNLMIAAAIYGALAFPLEAWMLERMLDLGLGLALSIGVTALALFAFPVYLASQTVPMLAELTNREGKAGKASGKVLFFSTIGSVIGGIVTPIWLFPALGVAHTTIVVCVLLASVGALLAVRRWRIARTSGALASVVAIVVGVPWLAIAQEPGYRFDSEYQSFQVVTEETDNGPQRVLVLGGGRASGIYTATGETAFRTVIEAGKAWRETGASDILVIGSAGFTFPRDAAREAHVRRIDAVDVDPMVKPVAEREFLKAPLPKKVNFVPLSARDALSRVRREGRRYGFTFIDAYCGKGVPPELLTVEFFASTRAVSDHTVINAILDRDMSSAFARNFLASFRAAYGRVYVKHVYDNDDRITNIMVADWPVAGTVEWHGTGTPYTDDRDTADRDRVELIWGARATD